MTRVNSIKDIGLVYEEMKATAANAAQPNPAEVVEEKAVKKLESFPKATDKKIDTKKITAKESDAKAFFHKNSGPAAAEGFNKNIIDPKTAKKDNFYQPQKFSTALEKTGSGNINNHMKSIFDKLFEDVMGGDALDLGVQAGPEGAEADATDLGLGNDDTTVTLKLDKELAQKLHDALMAVLSDEDGEGEGEGDSSEDASEPTEGEPMEDKGEEEETVAAETVEAEEIGHALVGSGIKGGAATSPKGQSNVVKGTVTGAVKHGTPGKSQTTDKVGNDGEKGHALVGSGIKGGAATSPKGRANVVPGVIKGGGKGDQSLFQ
jgi:cobalamin biosynthesis protein CobT